MTRSLQSTLLTAVLLAAAAMAGCVPGIPVGTEPYAVAGQGGPVVVFDAGFGDDRQTWKPVFPAIAADTTVFAFERPGYVAGSNVNNPAVAGSDGMTMLAEQAQHLHALLARAQLAPPYVLVGHSLGGMTLLAFAKNYPDEVAGIVFVDGRLPGFTAACEAAGFSNCVPPREALEGESLHLLAERDGFVATELSDTTALADLDIPATFIVATKPVSTFIDADAEARQRAWMEFQHMSAKSMRDGRYVEAVGAGHYVHRAQPGLVIAEIRNMLARVRTGTWPAP
jgi:pimeloyl-ACP methyl ester carboxylesterase